MFTAKSFFNSTVMSESKFRVGEMFLKSMRECDNAETGNEYLLAAYILKLPNYFQIEDEFCKKFPIIFKVKNNGNAKN